MYTHTHTANTLMSRLIASFFVLQETSCWPANTKGLPAFAERRGGGSSGVDENHFLAGLLNGI